MREFRPRSKSQSQKIAAAAMLVLMQRGTGPFDAMAKIRLTE